MNTVGFPSLNTPFSPILSPADEVYDIAFYDTLYDCYPNQGRQATMPKPETPAPQKDKQQSVSRPRTRSRCQSAPGRNFPKQPPMPLYPPPPPPPPRRPLPLLPLSPPPPRPLPLVFVKVNDLKRGHNKASTKRCCSSLNLHRLDVNDIQFLSAPDRVHLFSHKYILMSLRPPSTSPSPSPAPNAPPSPSSDRPTSELLGGTDMSQTPEFEAIVQWFEDFQNYEATLEEMAAASLDVNFKEELSAIEQWFRVLSEAERTAALYSLLQHSTQVQIRFFITVLQQMARADPMTALLSPNAGGSMQSQMEAKLAQMGLKSPGLKSNMPSSPSARNFSGNIPGNRQSLAVESQSSSFLSPGSAVATLAQQGAKFKANAVHRISAPVLIGGNNVWGGSGANALGQVAERSSDSEGQELTIPALSSNGARPKSTDFSSLLPSRLSTAAAESDVLEPQLSPMVGGNWASMVNTPRDFMFDVPQGGGQNLDAAATKLATWQAGTGNSGGRFSLENAKKFRLTSRSDGKDQRGGNNGLHSPAHSNVSKFSSDNGGLAALNINTAAFGFGISSPGMAKFGPPKFSHTG
ncbi:hypothetical protein PNOK_0686000 [Pyrrhoderma noxium]|uniref:RNA-binding protein vts1-like alpha-helical domain-containing protein n=1 Tax=Pyrrhoderma noxium TaxID=2282107 RepID=A0A286UB73_9AGAM|nr:hypothetical protein PNOK_0686000 [Pyrrhoderma noxium]